MHNRIQTNLAQTGNLGVEKVIGFVLAAMPALDLKLRAVKYASLMMMRSLQPFLNLMTSSMCRKKKGTMEKTHA